MTTEWDNTSLKTRDKWDGTDLSNSVKYVHLKNSISCFMVNIPQKHDMKTHENGWSSGKQVPACPVNYKGFLTHMKICAQTTKSSLWADIVSAAAHPAEKLSKIFVSFPMQPSTPFGNYRSCAHLLLGKTCSLEFPPLSICVSIYALRLGSYYFNPTEYRGMNIAQPLCAGYKNRLLIYTYAQCDYANHDLALKWYV